MTPDVFLQSFEEFVQVSPIVVQAKLLQAAARMGGASTGEPDPTVWGPVASLGQNPTIADIAHGNLAAHYLITSPYGAPMRLKGSKGSTYLDVFNDLELSVAGGFIVSGERGGFSPGSSGASGSLQLAPGAGTVSVTNGSTAVTFSIPQSLPAGTILAFIGAQPGALYVVYQTTNSSESAVLCAPYSGPTNTQSSWNVGAG